MLPVPDSEALAHAFFDLVERGGLIEREELWALIDRYETTETRS